MKIPMLCSLLVTLMLIHKIDGLMAIQINNEGIAIDNLLSALDLNQIICEPTNFE